VKSILLHLWEAHCRHEFETRDVDATMATMVAEPYVNHVPTMTGGVGHDQLKRFYKYHFIGGNPEDTTLTPVSRTVGADQIVDELLFSFTHTSEIEALRSHCERARAQVNGPQLKIGIMVEVPAVAVMAEKFAPLVDFFSVGTNDLTQTTFGISRDDSGRFLAAYMDKGIFEADPFVRLDQEGVGDLIRIAAERGRAVRPGIKMGICGEHGGDPASIAFCETVGLDYVSCSPYRVPIARLAAAQAALDARKA